MTSPPVRRALISVSDKSGLAEFARGLAAAGVEIYSTGGTRKHLEEQGLKVVDVAGRSVARVIEDVGTRTWGIGLSPDGSKVYTANGPGGDISIVDVASGKVERRIDMGGSPWGIAVTPSK